MILLLALLAAAPAPEAEHTAAAPSAVALGGRAVPEGPPRTLRVGPGEPLDAAVGSLPAGSTLVLLPGEHAGPLLIDRPLTVEGPGHVVGGGTGSVVVVGAPDVTLRDLEISGSGHDATMGDAGLLIGADRFRVERVHIHDTFLGIDVRMADDGLIADCLVEGREAGPIGVHGDGIRLWESDRNELRGNHLEHVRDVVAWYSEHNRFLGNVVRNSRYGLHFMHADHVLVADNRFEDDIVGVFVMYSEDVTLRDNLVVGADGAAGMGFGFKEADGVVAERNRLLASTVGVYLDNTPNRPDRGATFTGNLLAYDHVGIRFHGVHAGAVFEGNEVHEAQIPVAVDGNTTAAAARFEGNRWSDYAGYDLDGDGYGDLPHAPRRLSRAVVDRSPAAAFFDGTPAALLIDLVGGAFPMWAPPPLFTDPRPRLGRLGDR